MRILIVEDDPSIHRIISRRLKEEGYAVDDCYDGEEGVDYSMAAAYDCVILDAAGEGRHHCTAGDQTERKQCAGADADGEGYHLEPRGRTGRRGGRLPDKALCLRRAVGEGAGAAAEKYEREADYSAGGRSERSRGS